MAASRNKVAVGSAPWILGERDQASQFVEQEVEEFSYAVRNDLEWLNEHMADIFTKAEINVTDVFKTPGKLRGKTPRTARKRNPLETRAPLTDIFAPNPMDAPSPPRETPFYKQLEQIQIAEDPEDAEMPPPPQPASEADHTEHIPPGDSGYHGMTEDEMDDENDESVVKLSPRKASPAKPIHSSPPKTQETQESKSASASFVSAKEDQIVSRISIHEDEDAAMPEDDEMDLVPTQPDESEAEEEEDNENTLPQSPSYSVGAETASALQSVINAQKDQQAQMDEDGARTPSDGSSPAKPLLRKSSLTFSSLPAREPLAGKKSMGNRISRTSHVDQYKARSSHFGRFTGGKSLGGSQAVSAAQDEDEEMHDDKRDSTTRQLHSKTSTQRLHERINMLGQSQESRTSKSTHGLASQEPAYPQLPTENDESDMEPEVSQPPPKAPSPVPYIQDDDDDEDDWIAPVTTKPSVPAPIRPALRKSNSTDIMEDIRGKSTVSDFDVDIEDELHSEKTSPAKSGLGHLKSKSVPNFESADKAVPKKAESAHKKAASVSDPNLAKTAESSTPAGSPSRNADEPVSASRSKFYSVLKSAKSIFASSAGVSAQAKLEALSPSAATIRNKTPATPAMEEVEGPSRPLSSIFDKPMNPASPAKRHATGISSPGQNAEARKTRGSLQREEREREAEAQEKKLEEARELERKKAAAFAEKEKQREKSLKESSSVRAGAASRSDTVSSHDDDSVSADEMPAPAPAPKAASGPPKMRSRIVKPSKDTLPKPRTHIKVPLGSQRTHPTNADLSKSLQGTLPPKTPGDSASSSFTKSTGPVAKPTSLALAAKNKEREEREAQRKAEKKRAIEQQRAAKAAKAEEERRKADEERRAEAQKKIADQQRALEAKRAAANRQALAAEAKKQEQARAHASHKQTNDLAHALQQEKEKANTIHGHPRGDMASARPVSRMGMSTVSEFSLNRPVNPAKPPKRDRDDEPARPQVQRNGPSYQRLDANANKRRKTLEDEDEDEPADNRRSMMGQPIRPSNVRKMVYPERERLMNVIDKAKEPSRFGHGYTPASAGPSSHSSIFKQTVTAQHQMQHSKYGTHPKDMATISKAKIPFADAPSQSSAAAAGPSSQNFKTPLRTNTTTVPLASPHFPTPELPEIATDSEDEDSDGEAANFRAPSWVNSPALRELLSQQQLVDPMEVFGPIPPLQMEEIFKNKDRHKRFRERTSSAHWTHDKLTEEERKKDREGRERLMRDGGWTYGNSQS